MTTSIKDKKVYRVQGFTCANCAAKFEHNVKALPGINEAKVNFGAAKLTVYGNEPTIAQLETAGAFENLKVFPAEENMEMKKVSFWQSFRHPPLLFSILFLFGGWGVDQVAPGHFLGIVLYVTSMVIGGYRLFIQGFQSLLQLQFDMRTLMIIAIVGAAAIGEWGEGATVVILFAISEVLERFSMEKARLSIRSLMEIAPREALIQRGNETFTVPVDEIEIGDVMLVKPGEKIAMDGIVLHGTASVNQAAITGESMPMIKRKADEVYAGTFNEDGLLEVKMTKRVEDTTIAKIIHLVEEAQAERAPAQTFVDRFARIYTPAILVAGLLLAIIPPLLFQGNWDEWIYRGLALLVVGCPCALVISTPVAIVTAVGNAARQGVLIKGGIHLEELGQVETVAFDKTGTLTKGKPVVTDLIAWGEEDREKYFTLAAALEQSSQHPLAFAILHKAKEEELEVERLSVDDFRSQTGKGIQAKVDHTVYLLGSPAWIDTQLETGLSNKQKQQISELQVEGKTVMVLSTEQEVLLCIAVADELREQSKKVISQLRQLGIKKTVILTGDHPVTAEAIGQRVGVDEIQANLLPEQKQSSLTQWQAKGTKIAMLGDGINDAPALAVADVGIAMGGTGTDTALETADIALMGDDLEKLPFTIRLSRKALKIIKQNITFSLVIKACALLLIIPGWLTLWMAIFADMGATLLVTLNGMRLLKMSG